VSLIMFGGDFRSGVTAVWSRFGDGTGDNVAGHLDGGRPNSLFCLPRSGVLADAERRQERFGPQN
jgi:hypothetical protein